MICPKCRTQCVKTSWCPSKGINPDLRQRRCPNCKDEYYVDGTADDVKPASGVNKRSLDPRSRMMTQAQIQSLFLYKG